MPSVQVPPFWHGLPAHSFTSVHVTPSPSYPALQAQVKEPGVSVHAAFASQSSVPRAHSSTSVQVTPSPSYPALQAQVKEPGVLVHAAFASQLSVPRAHSFTSVHVPLWQGSSSSSPSATEGPPLEQLANSRQESAAIARQLKRELLR
ncbi:hypothetical protein BE17_29190 [Sorangium cellulosum]|uniref:Uncharacterized protein n=1 Tax=Sorangium cellulosum TaxID=56 RepID=A0A150SAI1_SORCE|nr:hypothetical protein BE17_29190 [Sorangium cellulosum]